VTTTRHRRRGARVFVVAAGGILGSAVRVAVGTALGWQPGAWPAATLLVNVAGAGLLGWYLARLGRAAAPWWSLDFWAIGVLGSFTTFSALSIETVTLLEAGRAAPAFGYAVISPLAGLLAAAAGDALGASR
jgi:CrcB protein